MPTFEASLHNYAGIHLYHACRDQLSDEGNGQLVLGGCRGRPG